MTTVLVSGSTDRVEELVAAFQGADTPCIVGRDLDSLRSAVADIGDDRVDAYVQLPATIRGTAETAIGQVRELLTEGLVARFDAADIALAAVRDGGVAVLVAGNNPGASDLSDDRQARYALLRVLSHAILADNGGRGIRAVVMAASSSADEILDAVLGAETSRQAAIAEFVERESELGYADWRVELLSLATNES